MSIIGYNKESVENMVLKTNTLFWNFETGKVKLICLEIKWNDFRASSIEIKMFSPSNLPTTSHGRTKATTKDGYLEVEVNDAYGDLHTTWDVVMAWMTLSSIWQKLFPTGLSP